MIIITGANGRLGRQVVEQLLERLPADRVGVSVREPEKARDLEQRGVRVRGGDFDVPAGLADAFEGATRVLVVSASAIGDTAKRWNRTAIEAAAAAGAERIFYTSHVGAAAESPFPPMPTHFASEAVLRETGVPFTALRNGFYAESAPLMLGDALQTGELRGPEDGPISWTTRADLAEAIAVALADDELGEPELALTAAQAVDLEALAGIASEVAGRPVERIVVSDDEYRAGLLARGMPEPSANMTLGIFQAARQGQFARVDPTLERLIGRAPTSVADVLRTSHTG